MARVHVIDSVFKSIHRNGNYVSNGVYTIMKMGNLIKDFVLFGKHLKENYKQQEDKLVFLT